MTYAIKNITVMRFSSSVQYYNVQNTNNETTLRRWSDDKQITSSLSKGDSNVVI